MGEFSSTQLILVVEDEPLVQELVALNLKHAGFAVAIAQNVVQAQIALSTTQPTLAIVDAMLPDGDGFLLTRQARDQGLTLPILLLTARNDTQSKVRGLDCGADDYLTKPFDVPELLARVRALLRRGKVGGTTLAAERWRLGNFWARFDTGEAFTHEGDVRLSEKELGLLMLFHKHENQLLSRADILEEVWGMDSFPTDRTVDNFILRLRKLFEPLPDEPRHFITLRGRGYLFRR